MTKKTTTKKTASKSAKTTKKAAKKTAPALNLESDYVTQWTPIKLAVLQAVKGCKAKDGISTPDVMEAASTGKRVTRRHLYSMRQEGLIEAHEYEGVAGYFWTATAAGKKFKPEDKSLKAAGSQTAAQRSKNAKKKAAPKKKGTTTRKRSTKKAASAGK